MKRAAPERAPGPASPARPRASRERQRQRLIDACISALHVYGPSNTTVEKVVAIARMSPGIVRFYFESKAAMLVASLEYLAAEFEDRVLVPVGALRATPVVALERLVELYLGPEIASARKVSVWYSFWGEASSRQEYFDICGTRDERFEVLVRELIGRLIEDTRSRHLDADAIALGLIGVLEMLWQSFAFQTESTIDRAAAGRRGMAYLRSVFPSRFPPGGSRASGTELPPAAYRDAALLERERSELFHGSWQFIGLKRDLRAPGDFLTLDVPGTRALVVREPRGGLRAFHNACRQRPHALSASRAGHFDGVIDCALHGLRYNLLGESVGDTPGGALRELELASAGEFMFVRVRSEHSAEGQAPAPRAAFAASELELTSLGAPVESEIAADWKVVVEHWLEAPNARPASAATPGGVEFAGAPRTGAGWSEQRQRALAPAADWQRSLVAPNQLIVLGPGRVEVTQVLPLEAGRCLVRVFAFAPGAQQSPAPALAFLAARIARVRQAAERSLAVSVQKGFEAGAPAGTPLAEASVPLAEFRHRIARLLPHALLHSGDST